jgi:hypothetical protein
MDKTFADAFNKVRNRQVAAIIHYKCTSSVDLGDESSPQDTPLMIAESLSEIFNRAAQNENPLIRRRAWFKHDSCDIDEHLVKIIGQIMTDKDDIKSLYENLPEEPTKQTLESLSEYNQEDEIQQALQGEFPPVIRLEFSNAVQNTTIISTAIPFKRLRRDMHRLNRALDASARGSLEDITIVHSPVFSKELSKEQISALLKPR